MFPLDALIYINMKYDIVSHFNQQLAGAFHCPEVCLVPSLTTPTAPAIMGLGTLVTSIMRPSFSSFTHSC